MLLLGIAFFLSGVAALVYQVIWQRILTLHTGIGVVSVALIVAAFMAGLGLGSHVGGVLSARVSPAPGAAAVRPRRAPRGALRGDQLPALLRWPRHARRGPLPDDRGHGGGALRGLPPAHDAHGHVAALPGARHGAGDGVRLPRDRRAVRRQRAGRGGRRPPRPLGPRALPRDGGCGARGRRRQPHRRRGRARRGPPPGPRRRTGRGGARRPSRRRGGDPRPLPGRLLRPVGGPLRPVRLSRAVARDHVVPPDGRRGQEHGLHLRDRPVHLPPRPRRRQPRGRPPGRAARAARSTPSSTISCSSWPPPAAPWFSSPGCPPARPSTTGSSTTGGRTRSSSSARTGTWGPSPGSTASCPSPCSACRPS